MQVSASTKELKDGRAIELRSPTPEDAESRLIFLRSIFHDFSDNLNHPPDYFDAVLPDSQAKSLKEIIASENVFITLAILDARIIGDLTFRGEKGRCNHCGELGMSVLKEFQGNGVGQALLDHCFDEAKRLGFSNLLLKVRTFNLPAIRLYEKMGFERIGLIKAAARLPSGYVDEFLYQRLIF